ncbi:HYR-like domain-containing protein, partial [Flavisericum labens]|uniref:HYR-like domain-containing protein n=1 Tax=Flavisericum labens TaxID=3377112 RepID=UPI00387B5751
MKKNYIYKSACALFILLLSGSLYARSLSTVPTPTSPIHHLQYKLVSFFSGLLSNDASIKESAIKESNAFALAAPLAAGDYRSVGSGDWNDPFIWEADYGAGWVSAVDYPGLSPGTNEVTIQATHTINLATNLASSMGDLVVDGTLNITNNITTPPINSVTVTGTLDLDTNSSPWEVTLNTTSIDINGASTFLEFSNAQASLLLPAGASVTFQNGGDIAGSCTPNNEIIIDGVQYAACRNPSAGSYTFGQVLAAGGTINAQITTPATSPISSEVCSTINFEGGYSGTGTNVTADWVLRFPDGTLSTLVDDFALASQAATTSSSFTPTVTGEYVLTLEVTDGSVTNAANVVFDITADVTDPIFSAPPADVTVSCISNVPAMTNLGWTDNCDGSGTVVGSDSSFSGCEDIITRTWSYTDIAGNPASAAQLITIDYAGALTPPALGTSTVACPADAT